MVRWTYPCNQNYRSARCIFIDLQLELQPYQYYNTLGLNVELIDFIDHVDDTIVLEKITPLYMDDGVLQLIQESVFGCIICILHVRRSLRFGNW